MIPISLTLQGIYSYKNKITIDFKNLTSAHLFGIFGPVGCGKSSILEAISFALYGEIERLNIKDNRNYNIMNLSSDSIFIEFIFSAGTELNEYKFTVNGKRNSKHFEKVEKIERNAYKKNKDQWIPLEEISAEKIIGLSYENFRRAIIIPQGKFNEFLNLGNTDRTQMLKEIFHLEKFELSGKTKYLEIKNKEEQKKIDGALSQIKDISEQTIKEKEEELKKLKVQANSLIDQLSEKEKTYNYLNLLKNLFEKHQENKTVFEKLLLKEKEYLIKEENLNKYEICFNKFKDILSQKDEREKRIKNDEKDLAEQKDILKKLENKLNIKKDSFKEIKESFNNKENLIYKNHELGTIIKIKKVKTEIPAVSEKFNNFSKNIKEKQNLVDALKKQKRDLQIKINEQKKDIPDPHLLSELKLWFEQKNQKQNLIKKTEDNINKEINENLPLKIDLKQKNFSEISENLNNYKNTNQEQIEFLKNQFNELQLSQKLYDFSHNLREGEPCPLCGSKEHPAPLKIDNVSENIESTGLEINKVEKELEQMEKLLIDINELEKINNSLNKHLSTFKWEKYSIDDEEKINKDFDNLQEISNEINILNNDLETTDINIEDSQNHIDAKNKELFDINTELASLKAREKSYFDELKKIDYNEYENIPVEKIQDEINAINNLIKEIGSKYENYNNDIKKIEDEKNQKQGRIKKLEENISDSKILLDKDTKEINSRIKKNNFNNLDEIHEILNKNMDIAKEKNDILNFKKTLHAAKENYENSKLEIHDKTYNEVTHKIIAEELTSLKTNINNYNQKIGGFANSLKEMKSDLKKKNKFEKEIQVLKEKADNISVLLKLFRGSGFVNYISSIYLNNLCNSANERFYKLTRQNLKLEVNEDNSLQIRDFLNNGQTRSVKTLSGGQSFQVSLSLALSLAENISQTAGMSQNFFFIDEGFGSLDRESLQLVFNSLKSLRKENRIVGVISHLEELKLEIDVYLEVENDPEEGSKIKSSLE